MQLSNNKILITGGATGIGLGLTERFIQENNTVIICGRREDVLKQVADRIPGVITKVCNLSDEQERVALRDWIQENHSDLNVLVNNAGIQKWMKVTDDDFYANANDEITTNLIAPVHLTSLFLGLPSVNTIMNVTSGLAFIPLSKVPVYCATKAFMRSFTLSLRHQLKGSHVEVIEIVPPGLNTDLGAPGIHDSMPPVSAFIDCIFGQLKEGRNEVAFATSEARLQSNNESIAEYFSRMNP